MHFCCQWFIAVTLNRWHVTPTIHFNCGDWHVCIVYEKLTGRDIDMIWHFYSSLRYDLMSTFCWDVCTWWRHQMETFSGPGEFPAQRPVTRSFDVFFDLRLDTRLSKQPWGWWFEILSWSLWRQCNDYSRVAHDEVTKASWYRHAVHVNSFLCVDT